MKSIWKGFVYFVGGLITFALLYFAADAILSRIAAPGSMSDTSSAKRYPIYVLSNDVHTDLVFPVVSDQMDWRTIFPPQDIISKDSTHEYIAVGWGDKGFYLHTPEWKDLTAKTALVAALGLGETALHVTYHSSLQEGDLCYKIMVDSLQFAELKNYVLASCLQDDKGQSIVIPTDAQYGDSDAFYEAKGAYSMFHSCNTWANTGLKKAKMPSAVWTVFDKGILRHYRK